MFQILKRCDQRKGSIAAVEFEGEPYGAGISFFVGNLQPGKGPGLHQHPYPETCIVISGQAAMVVDGNEVVAAAGDIIIVGAETPHRFTAIGDERRWEMRGIGVGGGPFRVTGEYSRIEPPRLLEFTWLPSWQENAAESLVRFDLEEKDGFTTVRATHSGLISESARTSHKGWPQILMWLRGYAERHVA